MKEKSLSFESSIWGVAMKCPECGSDQTITYAVWICPIEPKTEYTVCPTKTKKRCEDCGHVCIYGMQKYQPVNTSGGEGFSRSSALGGNETLRKSFTIRLNNI